MTGLFLYTFLIYPDDRIHGIWVFAVIIPVAFAAMPLIYYFKSLQ
jgi:hypothetical protein